MHGFQMRRLSALLAVAVAAVVLGGVHQPEAAAQGSEPTAALTVVDSMSTPRVDHTASRFHDGRVLVVGGTNSGGPTTAVEVYDPVAQTWASDVGPLAEGRTGHAAIVPSGRGVAIVFGGLTAGFQPLTSTPAYILPEETIVGIADVGELNVGRGQHTATLLSDEREVLIVGGFDGAGPVASAERYVRDPGVFVETGSLNTAREAHSATLLADGRVLVVGGQGVFPMLPTTAELYGSDDQFSAVPGPVRFFHTATRTPDSAVLVIGGCTSFESCDATNAITRFDPTTNTFSEVGSLQIPRERHAATLLPNGQILVTGGEPGGSAELVDPATGDATLLSLGFEPGAFGHTATLLADDTVLVAGGSAVDGTASSQAGIVSLAFSEPAQREVTLASGWNLVGWTGNTAVADATAPIAGQFGAIFGWDATGQAFQSFQPTVPPFLNTLTDLRLGDGLFIFVTDATGAVWPQPAATSGRNVPLLPGFNLVMWTGPDGTPVGEAVSEVADAINALFTWDAALQQFRTFAPDAPSFLNSLAVLNHGDGVWIQVDQSVTWRQPAPN